MAGLDDDYDADLADRGDDRPGVDEAEGDDYSALGLDDDFDDDDDDDEDYPDDAGEDEIDLVVALYREDGTPVVQALERSLRRVSGTLLHDPTVRATRSARSGELDDYQEALVRVLGIEVDQ